MATDHEFRHRWDSYLREQDLLLQKANDWFGRGEQENVFDGVPLDLLAEMGLDTAPTASSVEQSPEFFKRMRVRMSNDSPHPADEFKQKLETNLHVASLPQVADDANDSVRWFTKAMRNVEPAEAETHRDRDWARRHSAIYLGIAPPATETTTLGGFLQTKVSEAFEKAAASIATRTTNGDNDGGSLAKKTDFQHQLEKLVDQVRKYCIADEEERLDMGLKCADHALVVELTKYILQREQTADSYKRARNKAA